ncbi:MAG: phosphate signaling complex protein PhoU [Deinococcales bacterium]
MNPAKNHLDLELTELRREWLLMLNRASVAFGLATQALLESNRQKAERAIDCDGDVDERQTALERRCLELISKYAPQLGDLRFVTSVLASLSELERIGDYAVHIAKDVLLLATPWATPNVVELVAQIRTMTDMLDLGIAQKDPKRLGNVVHQDRNVDQLVEHINHELMQAATSSTEPVAHVLARLRVVRSLQRIGDHLENVAERAIFWLTGERTLI